MVKYSSGLDTIFGALANDKRREMLVALSKQPRSISELAEPLGLSLPAISKHIKVLEEAQLITYRKVGRSSEIVLKVRALAEAEAWIEFHRNYWNRQLDSLGKFVDELNERKQHGPND